jgi:RimJ/RimL family protein N-acetyltransferase
VIGEPLIDSRAIPTAIEPRASVTVPRSRTARGELARALIRPAVVEDLDAIVSMTRLLALETVGKTLPPQQVRAGVESVFDSPGRGRYYLACVGSQVVGQLAVLYVELNAWRNGLIYWIDDVYVRTEWRCRGVYRSLFAFVQEMVLATPGVRGTRLRCAADNHPAQAAYRRLGMRPGGVMMEWFWPDNADDLPPDDGAASKNCHPTPRRNVKERSDAVYPTV